MTARLRIAALTLVAAGAYADGRVRIEGLDGAHMDNARQSVLLAALDCDEPTAEVRRLFRDAPAQIRASLEPFGYYSPTIEPALRFGDDCWHATFAVNPGPATLIETSLIDVDGDTTPATTRMLDESPLAPGSVLDHRVYEGFKDRLRRTALDAGYLDAHYATSEVHVFPERSTAAIDLRLVPGQRYRIGQIDTDVDFLDEDLLDRLLTIAPGDWVSRQAFGRTRRDLMRTGYFESIRTVADEDPDTATVNLNVIASPSQPVEYTIGLGLSSDFGPFATGTYLNKRVNRRGHRLEGRTEVGTVAQDLQLEYRLPGQRPLADWLSLYAGVRAEDTDDAIESRAANVGARSSVSMNARWRMDRFVDLTFDRVSEDGARRTLQSLVPGIGFSYRNATDDLRPTGMTAMFEAAATHDSISDATFVRVYGRVRTIFPSFGRTRWLLRGELGYLETDDLTDVPTRWRFFAGGDQSVRGFGYHAIGPTDAEGDATGGEWLGTTSVEYDVPVHDRWSVALFVDTGNTGVGSDDNDDGWPFSAGFGGRWLSPVGPVRVDLAFPLEGSNDAIRLHISLGPDL